MGGHFVVIGQAVDLSRVQVNEDVVIVFDTVLVSGRRLSFSLIILAADKAAVNVIV